MSEAAKAHRLKNLRIEEISSVGKGAGRGTVVTFMKMEGPAMEPNLRTVQAACEFAIQKAENGQVDPFQFNEVYRAAARAWCPQAKSDGEAYGVFNKTDIGRRMINTGVRLGSLAHQQELKKHFGNAVRYDIEDRIAKMSAPNGASAADRDAGDRPGEEIRPVEQPVSRFNNNASDDSEWEKLKTGCPHNDAAVDIARDLQSRSVHLSDKTPEAMFDHFTTRTRTGQQLMQASGRRAAKLGRPQGFRVPSGMGSSGW